MTTRALQPNRHARRRQCGAALVVSLLVLMVLTLLGLSSMSTTLMEERMAGHLHSRNLAFEAAEASLRNAEDYVASLVTTGDFDGTDGLYGRSDPEPDAFATDTWSGPSSRTLTSANLGTAKQPRYTIKIMTTVDNKGGSLNQGGYGQSGPASDVTMFRITARGIGATGTARVYLQSEYGKIF